MCFAIWAKWQVGVYPPSITGWAAGCFWAFTFQDLFYFPICELLQSDRRRTSGFFGTSVLQGTEWDTALRRPRMQAHSERNLLWRATIAQRLDCKRFSDLHMPVRKMNVPLYSTLTDILQVVSISDWMVVHGRTLCVGTLPRFFSCFHEIELSTQNQIKEKQTQSCF